MEDAGVDLEGAEPAVLLLVSGGLFLVRGGAQVSGKCSSSYHRLTPHKMTLDGLSRTLDQWSEASHAYWQEKL